LWYRLSIAPLQALALLDGSVAEWRVLIVKDHKVKQLVMSKNLTSQKVNFAVAENCVERLEDTFAHIFIDCQMPMMDDLEASKRIRQSDTKYGRSKLWL
jgi:CheY-like chemotaxis protein